MERTQELEIRQPVHYERCPQTPRKSAAGYFLPTIRTDHSASVECMTSNTRHRSPVALVLIDVINDFDFPDGARLLRNALPIVPRVARLKARASLAGIPAIYVNDNFG